MSAFFVAQVRVKDPDKFRNYAQAAGKSMQPFGGSVLIKGASRRTLAGPQAFPNLALVQFPDHDSLEAWYQSAEYQSLLPLREEAADMVITSYEAAV